MTIAKRACMAASLWLGLTASAAQAGQQSRQVCVPPAQAEALLLTIAPELIRAVGKTCASALPANAYFRRSQASLIAKFSGHREASWAPAKEALRKIVGPDASALLDTDMGPTLVTGMMAPLLAETVKPKDCGDIDRVLSYLDPLPATNMAGLIVTIVQLSSKDDKQSKLPICPGAK